MASNDYLKYDIECIENSKKRYGDCITNMNDLKDNMQKVVDSVRYAWQSEAGEAFFKKYDDEWLKGFTHYTEVLQHMVENLDIATEKYSEVTQQANALNIK